MSQKNKSASPSRDHSPKRGASPVKASTTEIVQESAQKISFLETVVGWLGEPARRPLVKDWAGCTLRWDYFDDCVREYIQENFPDAKKPFPYFAVILYFVDQCYKEGNTYGKYELAVLMTRFLGHGLRELQKIRRFCTKIQAHAGRLGLDGSPFWRQMLEHLSNNTSWATLEESADGKHTYYTVTRQDNFVKEDVVTFEPYDVAPPFVRSAADPKITKEFKHWIHVKKRDEKWAVEARTRLLEPNLTEEKRLMLVGELDRLTNPERAAHVHVQEIEDFIIKRLPRIVPYISVGLPTFDGVSRTFNNLLKLEDLEEYGGVQLVDERLIIQALNTQ